MTNQPSQVLFVTDRPLFVVAFLRVLEHAGFDAPPVMRDPRDAFAGIQREDACLVFADARQTQDVSKLAQAVRRSPQSRFVLCGATVTLELLGAALECGAHGVLSANLPAEESADALARIWQGEKQFRFQGSDGYGAAAAASADFDAVWMFGHAV